MTWIDFFFFLRKYLAYHMYKPISIEEKLKKKTENSVFSGPIVLLFSLKSGPWTGNELATDDVEIGENSQLTLANLSHLLKFCISQRWNTLEIISDSDV